MDDWTPLVMIMMVGNHGRRLGAEFGGRKKISRTKFSNDPF